MMYCTAILTCTVIAVARIPVYLKNVILNLRTLVVGPFWGLLCISKFRGASVGPSLGSRKVQRNPRCQSPGPACGESHSGSFQKSVGFNNAPVRMAPTVLRRRWLAAHPMPACAVHPRAGLVEIISVRLGRSLYSADICDLAQVQCHMAFMKWIRAQKDSKPVVWCNSVSVKCQAIYSVCCSHCA